MSFDNTYIHCGKAMKMINKYNVFASLLSAKPEDAGMIAAWMADREAEKDMMNMEVVTCGHDATRLNEIRGGYEGNISVGDVRILSKQFTSEPDIIPYVAVLEEWEKDVWLIVPFSHYATPATPGEMSTGIDMHGLRVLQVGNGRTVQDDILKKSFLFDRLSDNVREDALALFRYEMGGVDLPASFSAQRGVPIINEDDPRREYLKECVERLNPLSEAVLAKAEQVTNVSCGVPLSKGIGGTKQDLADQLALQLPADFWKNAIARSKEPSLQYALAAATVDDKSTLWMIEGKDNSLETFSETCAECRFLKRFKPINSTRDPYSIRFVVAVPAQWKGMLKIPVVARNRATGELVGEGWLDTESGEGLIRTVQTKDAVENPHQIVLIVVRA